MGAGEPHRRMAGNRVEELEAKVRTLEATVDGLTDELVETKERLHALEAEVGVEPDVLEGRLTRRDATRESSGRGSAGGSAGASASGAGGARGTDAPAGSAADPAGDGTADADGGTAEGADAAAESADGVNTDEGDGEDNADSESGDDIIVA